MGEPDKVARVIAQARAPFPRARYLVGYGAVALAVTDRLTPCREGPRPPGHPGL